MDILNPDYILTKFETPYKIWILDDFLKQDVLNKIKDEWPNLNSSLWHTGHRYIDGKENILEQGMRSISKLEDHPQFTAEVLKYIHTNEFTNIISDIVEGEDLIPDDSMRWTGMRMMVPGSFQAIHSDARKHPETGFRKELTCLVYLNEEYDSEHDTGCFEVWNDDMTECVHSLHPLNNRLVIFLNTDKSYHGVPEVNFERRAILWSILKDAAAEPRSKALFVSRPNDSDEISKLGQQRAYIKDN